MGMILARVNIQNLIWEEDSLALVEHIDRFIDICEEHYIKEMFVLFVACWKGKIEIAPWHHEISIQTALHIARKKWN